LGWSSAAAAPARSSPLPRPGCFARAPAGQLPQDPTHQSKRHLSRSQVARCRSRHRRQRTTPDHRSL